jgi:hypothetical protein
VSARLKRAPQGDALTIIEAAAITGYHPDWLRKLIGSDDDPPPFHKERNRWEIAPSELLAWWDRRRP